MIWVVTANSNRCCIYNFDKHPATIKLLKELNHPETKLKRSALTSDKQGSYRTDSSTGGSYSPHTDPKEVEIDRFSREIAAELNNARKTNTYNNIIVITPSHMNGLLNKHMDKQVKCLIKNDIQKDVMSLSEHELLSFLQKNYLP